MITGKKTRRTEKAIDQKNAGWLYTFNDMMTLLLVFFVLIFSLGTLNVQDIQSAQLSLQSGLGIFEAGKKTSIGIVAPLATYDIGTATFTKKLEESLEDLNSKNGIGVTYDDKAIIIALEDAVLFQSGSADINSDGLLVLDNIGSSVLNSISNPVRIEGHTDTDPIHTKKFPSNWELSTIRSVNVLKYLVDNSKILPKRLSAVGYGDTKPLFPNDTPENKSRNRRVEIVITTDDEG